MSRLLILGAALALSGCAASAAEGLDASQLPADVRADYQLFARRCSKCHSLARALNSGVSDDAAWERYVTRMRRQPGSGISRDDATQILRFLHYYAVEQQQRQRAQAAEARTWR
jgi:mono/diheme cytochrome c family protein